MAKAKIRKGDNVIVIAGKDKGKKGEVIRVMIGQSRVVVKGINLVKKAIKKSKEHPNGAIMDIESPIHISNVQVAHPKTGKGIRVGYTTDKDGTKKRVSKGQSQTIID